MAIYLVVFFIIRYLAARAIKRKFIYHAGPTNSGKTYNALQDFLAAPTGIYCAPLRLLANEVYCYSNSVVSHAPLHGPGDMPISYGLADWCVLGHDFVIY